MSLRTRQRHRKDFGSDFCRVTRIAYLRYASTIGSLTFPQYVELPLLEVAGGRVASTSVGGEMYNRPMLLEKQRSLFNWVSFTHRVFAPNGISMPHVQVNAEHFAC